MPVGELRQLQRQNDHILQQQEERLRLQEEELRRRGGPASSHSSDKFVFVPATPDAVCIEVSHIDLAGVTLISASEIERLISTGPGKLPKTRKSGLERFNF
ncbi:MAG: hypothetical protein LBM64_05105 [Deltaproteobacteria bacterium]|nr:hypothetical protein [Deltaproteobacteria bacterium]